MSKTKRVATKYVPPVYLDIHTDDPSLLFKDFQVCEATHSSGEEICPLCKGHGGWNLCLDAYPGETPEQRHFRASCSQCWGHGYVYTESEKACIHSWERGRNVGHCLNEWVCTKCQKTIEVDSSD